jgi:hypothetical protein
MPNTAFLLADLAASIREHQDAVDRYLQQSGEYEVFNPFQGAGETSFQHMDASLPYTFWERLGIRHVISSICHNRKASQDHWPIAADKVPYQWSSVKKDACIEKLRENISNCSIIEFADYANVDDVAGFWDGLFEDVIKPLNKRDFEFIFHLGDIARRLVFEVDEMLDIIGDYSSHGRVSLILDDQEAGKLWNTLHGGSYGGIRSPETMEKYQSLFNAMRIDVLLILYSNGVLLFSRDGRFDFATGPLNNINMYSHIRDCFQAGFQLGLLLHLDIPHAIVLGLAVSGACQANTSMPTSRELLAYIDEWSAYPTTSSLTHRASYSYSG